ATLALAQSVEEWGWHDPGSLGGSPVLIAANVPDPDATADRMVKLGAELVIPAENRPYGRRQGRVKGPYGHLWVISGDLRSAASSPGRDQPPPGQRRPAQADRAMSPSPDTPIAAEMGILPRRARIA